MPKFIIQELCSYEIEAEDAQAALDDFLNNGGDDRLRSIDERTVFDESSIEQEVQD